MTKDISNSILLEHIRAMKYDLQSQISSLGKKIDLVDFRVSSLEATMDRRFEEARQHREALQEDLDVTMRTVYTHGKKLARSS